MIGNARLKIIWGDITHLDVEAVVNPANEQLLVGAGLSGILHKMAGPKLAIECQTLGGCKTGEAKITKGYNLRFPYVIHTVGPVWRGGIKNEVKLLKDCYNNSLALAVRKGIKSIAFPLISTGVFGYPIQKAAKVTIDAIFDFLEEDDSIKLVIVCCYTADAEAFCKEAMITKFNR